MKRVSISIFMIVLFCLVMTEAVHAQGPVPVQIPNYINYQGKLLRYPRNPDRAPIPANGTHTMTFRIYDAEDAPIDSPLWEETHVDVNVEIGIFNVLLGEVNPLYLRFEQDYWLGLEVYPDYEMQPRQRIVSTGYSFMSQDSYSLNGYVSGEGNGLNADMVDGINASATPVANKLLALDGSAEFPNSVLKMGEGRGLDADTVDGVHYSAIASQVSELDEKIEAHETNDEVMDNEGSYPNMSVGYANSAGSASTAESASTAGYASTAGSASTASHASTAGSVAWGNITGRPSGLDDGDDNDGGQKHCRGGNLNDYIYGGPYEITSGTCNEACKSRNLYCETALKLMYMNGWYDYVPCSTDASLVMNNSVPGLSCRCCDHNW